MRSMKVLVRQGARWSALAAHAYEGEQDLQELRAWSVNTMLRFVDVLRPELLKLKSLRS